KFFTRSVFDLRIEQLTLNLTNHSNKSIFTEKCFTSSNANQCHFILGICITETKFLNNLNQRNQLSMMTMMTTMMMKRPILINRQDNLIHTYNNNNHNRTSSFSWEMYHDLLPVDCEIGHEQILTGLLNINTSINYVNLTYHIKLSTMIKVSMITTI
ncbi:unnamed protein product, partial [Schistosoma turkestanicum]